MASLLRTSDAAAELRWTRLLELQVDQFLPYELHFLLHNERWLNAKRILDAGCGNGYFLSRVRDYFIEKEFSGLDVSGELVAAAQERRGLDGVSIVQQDFFTYRPPQKFDVVVMRLIVQHMAGFGEIFQKLDELLDIGGAVFVIEPEPRLFSNHPPTPVFNRLLLEYNRVAAQNSLNRASISQLSEAISQQHGWQLVEDHTLVAPTTGPFFSSALMNIFALWIDIFESSGVLDFDFDAARAELSAWSRETVSYNQFGIRIVEARRV